MTGPLLWIVLFLLSAGYIAASFWHTVVLLRARGALMPPAEVLTGICVYRAQTPEDGRPNQLYCRHFKCHGVLESAEVCASCRHRQLPIPGGRFFDHLELAQWPLIVLKQTVLMTGGLVAALYTVFRLWTSLTGDS